MADLVSLQEAKAWLDFTDTDSARDQILSSLAEAVSRACERAMGGRNLERTTYTEVLSGGGGVTLPVNNVPIRSVTSVLLNPATNSTPLTASTYTFDDNQVILYTGVFPRGVRNVRVVYSAGLDDVPEDVKLAAKYVIKAFWDARKTDMNSMNESWNAIGGSSFWPSGPGSIPPQALFLLRPYSNVFRAT